MNRFICQHPGKKKNKNSVSKHVLLQSTFPVEDLPANFIFHIISPFETCRPALAEEGLAFSWTLTWLWISVAFSLRTALPAALFMDPGTWQLSCLLCRQVPSSGCWDGWVFRKHLNWAWAALTRHTRCIPALEAQETGHTSVLWGPF